MLPTYRVPRCEVSTCEVVLSVKWRLSNVIGWMGYMADVLICGNSSFQERVWKNSYCTLFECVNCRVSDVFCCIKKIAYVLKLLPTCFVFISSLPISFDAFKLRTTSLDVISQSFPRYLNSVKVLRMCL